MSNLYNSVVVYDSTTLTFDGGTADTITGLPTLGVFVAFDDGPYVASPNWTEITHYVREASITRGRSDDYTQFPTATATLTLDNLDRVFDPFNTSSPYNGKLIPRRQIKIEAVANSTNHTIYRGFVAGWPVCWTDNGYDSTTTVDCFDLFGLLASTELPVDWAYQVTTDLRPVDYYRLDEPAGVAQFRNLGSNPRPLPLYGTFSHSKEASLASGLAFDSWNLEARKDEPALDTVLKDYSFSWWVRNSLAASQNIGGSVANFSAGQYGIGMFGIYLRNATPANSVIYFRVTDWKAGLETFSSVGAQFFNDLPQHIVVVPTASGTPTIYINGQAVPVTLLSTSPLTGPIASSERRDFLSLGQGTFQEVAVFDQSLTAADAASIYGAATNGYIETTSARAQRIMNTTDVPASLISITTDPVATVADFGTGSRYVLPELQTVADSEGGEVFVSKEGVLTFVNRWYAFGSPESAVVQATFSETALPYANNIEISYDADSIRNDIAVQYTNNAQVQVQDTANIAANGRNGATFNTRLSTYEQALSLATLELTVDKVLKPTLGAIEVGVTRSQSEWSTILGLDVLNRITIQRTPSVGSAITQTMLINRMTYSMTPDEWSVTVAGSARLTGWFVADYSLTDGSDVVL